MTNDEINRELAELLPWYANGTLNADETARVEKALDEDAVLRLQLDLIREDQKASVELAEEAPLPESLQARFNASLNAEIERNARAAAPRAAHARTGLLARFAAFMTPPRLALASAAAAAVIAIQAGLLMSGGPASDRGASYQTATGGEQMVVEGSEFLVSLSADASVGDLTAFLNEVNGRIVDGPGQSGLYRLRFAGDDAGQALERLSAESDLFAIVLPGASNN